MQTNTVENTVVVMLKKRNMTMQKVVRILKRCGWKVASMDPNDPMSFGAYVKSHGLPMLVVCNPPLESEDAFLRFCEKAKSMPRPWMLQIFMQRIGKFCCRPYGKPLTLDGIVAGDFARMKVSNQTKMLYSRTIEMLEKNGIDLVKEPL